MKRIGNTILKIERGSGYQKLQEMNLKEQLKNIKRLVRREINGIRDISDYLKSGNPLDLISIEPPEPRVKDSKQK
jgi:hypothetical protein